MESASAAALLESLEQSDRRGLYRQFASLLLPFADFIAFDPQKPLAAVKPAPAKRPDDPSLLRPLAKRFLPFICRAVHLLPALLRRSSKDAADDVEGARELIGIYALSLNCLACISPCLAGKRYSTLLHRGRLVCCLEAWGMHAEAEEQGLSVLSALCSALGTTAAPSKSRRGRAAVAAGAVRYLPDPEVSGVEDPDVAVLAAEVTISLSVCAHKSGTVDGAVYERVLLLVEQLQPWLRVMGAETSGKYRSLLVNALYKCSLLLAREAVAVDVNLVSRFCLEMLRQCLKSSLGDRFPSIARKICSSIDLHWEGRSILILDILRISLESIVCECKGAVVNAVSEFLEFISYCVDIFLTSTKDVCKGASDLLYKQGGDVFQVSPPIQSIMVLYATGLYAKSGNVQARQGDQTSSDASATILLLHDEQHLQDLVNSLDNLGRYVHMVDCGKALASGNELKDLKHMPSVDQYSGNCHRLHGYPSVLSYLDVLEFLCKLFVEYVNSAWRNIISKEEAAQHVANIKHVHDALHQFCDVVLVAFRCTRLSERERERLHDSRGTFLQVAVAAFKLSIAFAEKCQKSISVITHAISSEWIEPQELKFLISALHNIGASLYNKAQLEQASKALQLCCETIWTYLDILYQTVLNQSKSTRTNNISRDVTEDAIADSFAKVATILEVLHICGATTVSNVMVESLYKATSAEEIFQTLAVSSVLVKQWVKITCKDFDDVDAMDTAPVLYPLLLSKCLTWSKKAVGKILEQELLSYEVMETRNPNLCQKMQLKVIDILLNDVYTTNNYYLKRSTLLIKKGRSLRVRGVQGLGSCIECLSEAISVLKEISGDPQTSATIYHQLALTYCLHAQCSQEANQEFEVILHDVHCALDLWSSIKIQNNYFTYNSHEFGADNTIYLLCYISDLLSLKGCQKLQFDIFKLIIKFWKLADIPAEKCLAMLWSDRRLNHSLCISPIDEAYIWNISQQLNIHVNSVGFWITCLKGSPPSQLWFLQSLLIYDSTSPKEHVHNSERSFPLKVTIDEVKRIASSLISCVPMASQSAFMVGNLYHDLSERLFLRGRLNKALSYAREALCLRRKILGRKFSYSFQLKSSKFVDSSNLSDNSRDHFHLETLGSVVSEGWPDFKKPRNMQDSILSPWNVLRCYLESILQVAIMQEATGNGAEAEVFLQTGKRISFFQRLPLFEIAFTSLLGQLYRKMQFWDLAENELNSAKKLLVENDAAFSCKRCKMVFEVTIDMQLGDLSRNIFDKSLHAQALHSISHALDLYKSALGKLNNTEVEDSHSLCDIPVTRRTLSSTNHPERKKLGLMDTGVLPLSKMEARSVVCNICASKQASNVHDDEEEQSEENENLACLEYRVKRRSKRPSKVLSKEQNLSVLVKTRRSCRNKQSCHNDTAEDTNEGGNFYDKTATHYVPDYPNFGKSESNKNTSLVADFECGELCLCNKTKCWRCLLINVMEYGSLQNIIDLKWESYRRRLLVRLLLKMARCLGACGGNSGAHQVHEVLLQCVSLLFDRKPFSKTSPKLPNSCMIDLIGEEISGDIFLIERAVILYHISWFSLKDTFSENCRSKGCCLSNIQMPNIVRWLLSAFIICREFPLLFQKVSKLLATLFLLSTLEATISLPLFSDKSLSISHWAAYFHQASIGSFLHCQYLSSEQDKLCDDRVLQDYPGARVDRVNKASNIFRFAPEKIEHLEETVRRFYQTLSSVPVICLSMLDDDYVNVLGETLLLPSYFPAWMLLSRLHVNGQPITMLLPVDFISEETHLQDANSGNGFTSENKGSIKDWHCTWGYTVVDSVAPSYKLLLKENFLSLLNTSGMDGGQMSCASWWSRRTRLNNWLDKFLRIMENSWLGPWRCLLLGECSECKYLDIAVRKLVNELASQCRLEMNENLLKAILGGSKSAADAKACISQLLVYKGYFGRGACCGEERLRAFYIACSHKTERMEELVHEVVEEAIGEQAEEVGREPVILVLDSNVQMLPWENLPILRRQETYRMPSVSSISISLGRSYNNNKQVKAFGALFPSVDPLSSYYLLNPSGDLTDTQVAFEQWFRTLDWKGRAGDVPTTEELSSALQNHDLFVYFGHGSGIQYISTHEIQKLHHCAAALLMGCSSGSLTQKGCYAPQGAPVSYLLAGSPAVIANLWEVTDKDIDRFGKAMLDSWLEEGSIPDGSCSRCDQLVNDFGCISIDDEGKTTLLKNRKDRRGKKLQQSCDGNSCKNCGKRKRIASFMSQARDACKLPLLIGASAVCYGVPTIIKKKL